MASVSPPSIRVNVLDGFFVERSSDEMEADDSEHPQLFNGYKLASSSWASFKENLEEVLSNHKNPHHIKVLYFIRHAEGTHNAKEKEVGSARWKAEFVRSEDFLDGELTPFGVTDAQAKGRPAISAELTKGMPHIERVVVSPLSRTIQTAQNFFAEDQAPRPFIAMEQCREILGVETCNKRRPLSELRRKFPDVDFGYRGAVMQDEEDAMWSPTHAESREEIQSRALQFLAQLYREVPERYVAVVSHFWFIEAVGAIALKKPVEARRCECIPIVLQLDEN